MQADHAEKNEITRRADFRPADAREIHDYSQLIQIAHLSPQEKEAEEKRKNLRRNLWWQFPLLLPFAVFFVVLSFETTFLSPWHLLQGRDLVVVSVSSPLMLFMGAVLIPAWLIKWWLHASPTAQPATRTRWKNIARTSGSGMLVLVLATFVILLPAQFLIMPAFDYTRCSGLKFVGRGTTVPLPRPINWVKPDKAAAGWCAHDVQWMEGEMQYGHIPYQHAWLDVYKKGKARIISPTISPQGQLEIQSGQGDIARDILQHWNLHTWRDDNLHHYERSRKAGYTPPGIRQYWWHHMEGRPKQGLSTMVSDRYQRGRDFDLPIVSGVLLEEYEKIRYEIKTPNEIKDRLTFIPFSMKTMSRQPISNQTLDFTGYGCLYARLVMEGGEIALIQKAVLHPAQNCLNHAGLAALEPHTPPPPVKKLRIVAEDFFKYGEVPYQTAWLDVYARGKARLLTADRQWEITAEHGEVAQDILQNWNIATWRDKGVDPYNVNNDRFHFNMDGRYIGPEYVTLDYWLHPMDTKGGFLMSLRQNRFSSRSVLTPVQTGVLRRDYEAARNDPQKLAQLPAWQFARPTGFNRQGYPVTAASLDFTGYACLQTQLDVKNNKLAAILTAHIIKPDHCRNGAGADKEPRVDPPPSPEELHVIE